MQPISHVVPQSSTKSTYCWIFITPQDVNCQLPNQPAVSVAPGGLSASLWAEKLATEQHSHRSMKSLKSHCSHADSGWTLGTEEERKKLSGCSLSQSMKPRVRVPVERQTFTRNVGRKPMSIQLGDLISKYYGLLVSCKCHINASQQIANSMGTDIGLVLLIILPWRTQLVLNRFLLNE